MYINSWLKDISVYLRLVLCLNSPHFYSFGHTSSHCCPQGCGFWHCWTHCQTTNKSKLAPLINYNLLKLSHICFEPPVKNHFKCTVLNLSVHFHTVSYTFPTAFVRIGFQYSNKSQVDHFLYSHEPSV